MDGAQWAWNARVRTRKPRRWSGLPPLPCVAVSRLLTALSAGFLTFKMKMTRTVSTLKTQKRSQCEVICKHLKAGLANYGPWAKSGPPLDLVNKMWLKHNRSYLFMYYPWVLLPYTAAESGRSLPISLNLYWLALCRQVF